MLVGEQRLVGRTTVRVSRVGFGTGAIGNRRKAVGDADAVEVMAAAHAAGITYFDAAPMYGHGLAERRLGILFGALPVAAGVLSTKVGRLLRPAPAGSFDTGIWVDVPPMNISYDYSYDGTMRSIEDSMQRMLLDKFDIVYIHDCDFFTHGAEQPEIFRQTMSGAYRALLDLREAGVIGAIGMGVNDTKVCLESAEAGDFDAFLLAGRYTLLEHSSLEALMDLCQIRGISIIIGSAYNSGILATGSVDGAYYNNQPATPEILSRVREMETVARHHEVPLAAAAIQFAGAHPAVASVLIGMGSLGQVARNVEAAQWPIPDAFWDDLRSEGLIAEGAPVPNSSNGERSLG